MNKKRPSWWPSCPWPADVWPMTQEEYVKVIPDPKLRTALSGFLMRTGWELAEKEIWKCLKDGSGIYEKLKEILLSEK